MYPKKDTRKKTKTTLSSAPHTRGIELGKLPPQAVDLEEAVLGALMMDKEALANVIDILKPEMFYKETHRHIFEAIRNLFIKSEPVDILTVTQELKKSGTSEIAGGAFYLAQLTSRIASAANVQVHARIVLEKFIQRELIRISTDTLQHAYEDSSDVFELLNTAEQNLFSISQTNIRKDFESIRPLLKDTIEQIEAARDHKLKGVPSGFTGLDRITGGWQKSDLIILAARPGTGKSAFAGTIARNAAIEYGKSVAIFSLEMTAVQLVTRLIAAETELPSNKLRRGELADHEFQQLNAKIGKLTTAPLFIDDTPALSLFEFRAKARRLVKNHQVQLLIVDYLQLMVSGQEGKISREQEVSTISRSLKAIAKELEVPIIALSQMSREVEKRPIASRRPRLSDLRESGALEQDADLVIFIHHPESVGLDDEGTLPEGTVEIIIEKHRNGAVGTEKLLFISHFTKFVDLSSSYAEGHLGEEGNTIIRSSKMNDIEEDLE